MNIAQAIDDRLSLTYTQDGAMLFFGRYNPDFAEKARFLGGRLMADCDAWEFRLAARFPELENVVRTAAWQAYGDCPSPQRSDAQLFESWGEAMDEAVECGYLDGMLAGSPLS